MMRYDPDTLFQRFRRALNDSALVLCKQKTTTRTSFFKTISIKTVAALHLFIDVAGAKLVPLQGWGGRCQPFSPQLHTECEFCVRAATPLWLQSLANELYILDLG